MISTAEIRVKLPHHLRTLAGVRSEVKVEVDGPITVRSVLDALEASFPMLRGTIRDHVTQQRRPYLRYFACARDLSRNGSMPPAVEFTVEITISTVVVTI